MNRLPVVAMSSCALWLAPSAEASPPSWAPSAVSHVVEARCEAMVASLGFTILTGSPGPDAFRLDALSVKVSEDAGGARSPALPPLPAAIAAIDRPFLDRVVPTCTDNGVSFILYLASEAQVTRPGPGVQGAGKRLYVDVSRDAKANIYAAEPDAPMAR